MLQTLGAFINGHSLYIYEYLGKLLDILTFEKLYLQVAPPWCLKEAVCAQPGTPILLGFSESSMVRFEEVTVQEENEMQLVPFCDKGEEIGSEEKIESRIFSAK